MNLVPPKKRTKIAVFQERPRMESRDRLSTNQERCPAGVKMAKMNVNCILAYIISTITVVYHSPPRDGRAVM